MYGLTAFGYTHMTDSPISRSILEKMRVRISTGFLFAMLLPVFAVALSASDPICRVQETLARGSRGSAVTILQNFLKEQGTFRAEATGYFGPITEAALANWQLDVGIITSIVDGGVFGPRTRQYLRDQGCPAPLPSAKANTPPTKTTPPKKAEPKAAAKAQEEQCIAPETPLLSCSGYWAKTFNTQSCHVGWTCVSQAATSTTTATTATKLPVNRPPFISAIAGPTRLKPGKPGTWLVTASDPEYEAIEYSVIWGDEGETTAKLLDLARLGLYTFSRQTTYTHTYQTSGSYTIVVFARDISNNDTRATLSVLVESPPSPLPPPATNTNTSNANTKTTNTNQTTAIQCRDADGNLYNEGATLSSCLVSNSKNICAVSQMQVTLVQCQNGQWVSGAQTQTNSGPTGGTASCGATPHEGVVCGGPGGSCWLASRCCNGRWYGGGNIIGPGPSCAYWAGSWNPGML